MAEYDFHQLSPHDFELLTLDLLQAEWGQRIESFKTGRDSGIDLRYARNGRHTIVQCKHYVGTGLPGLLRALRKEAPKVRKLNPDRYVLVTSVPLSPANKSAIVQIIGNQYLEVSDIWGQEQLNNQLMIHPEIQGAHYKLWLTSRTVLDRVLNNAAVTQSEFKVKEVYKAMRRYVQSSAFPRAIKILAKDNFVVIAGPPGVGKTTLANMLLYEHLEKSYQAIVIQRDISEGKSLYQEGRKQIFYFDDFMGTTFLGDRDAGTNDDRALLDFIAMIHDSPNARLVLTTREHILQQGLERSERLKHSDMIEHRVILHLSDYTLGQRALILYNHLYFSDLPADYKAALLHRDFYFTIIKHPKFNPRLIEWLSTFRRVEAVKASRYRYFIEELLANPAEIWRHAYDRELSDAGQSMLLALFSCGGSSQNDRLRQAFLGIHKQRANKYRFTRRPEDFKQAWRELIGSFTKIGTSAQDTEVLDPSVLDLMNTVVRDEPENAIDLIQGATTFQQIERVWTFAVASGGQPVLAALKADPKILSDSIAKLIMEDRRVQLGPVSVAFMAPTYERRLAILLDAAEKTRHQTVLELIEPMMAFLLKQWKVSQLEISDAVEAVKAFDRCKWTPIRSLDGFRDALTVEITKSAQRGCSTSELFAVLSVANLADGSTQEDLCDAFDTYCHGSFREDLRNCRSLEQFDGLLEALDQFQQDLGVDASREIEIATAARMQFEQDKGDYEDHRQDEWNGQRALDRTTEAQVRGLFDTLIPD